MGSIRGNTMTDDHLARRWAAAGLLLAIVACSPGAERSLLTDAARSAPGASPDAAKTLAPRDPPTKASEEPAPPLSTKSAPANDEPAVGSPSQPPVGEGSKAACHQLTRTDCMSSSDCTLELASTESDGKYRCRPAEPPCETGLRQSDLKAEDCRARQGCVYRPAACYCPCRGVGSTELPDGDEAPPCVCRCGGGPPQTCMRRLR